MRQQYVEAVCREMEEVRCKKEDGRGKKEEGRGRSTSGRFDQGSKKMEEVRTIYLGGGTPSQLTTEQLRQLFHNIYKVYGHEAEEVTIEMNPDDVTEAYAEALPQLGINRVSMGAQTFDDKRLEFLHRRHRAEQVGLAVERLRKAGIRNISIDLMYGFPGETLDDWQRDIEAAIALDVEHISAYCLSIEENTPLWRMRNEENERMRNEENEKMRVDEELERAMYEMLIDKLTGAGYEHYEISNFARLGLHRTGCCCPQLRRSVSQLERG